MAYKGLNVCTAHNFLNFDIRSVLSLCKFGDLPEICHWNSFNDFGLFLSHCLKSQMQSIGKIQ